MIDIIVYLAIIIIVGIVLWWLLTQIPLPEPLRQILTIVIVVIGAVVLISLLLSFTGHGPALRLR